MTVDHYNNTRADSEVSFHQFLITSQHIIWSMEITGSTILITGGATGIGFSLAEEFVRLGNTVIVCGRREEKLREAKNNLPQLHTMVCDVSKDEDRKMLFDWITKNFNLNVLINNAGIQRMLDLREDVIDDEIDINFKAPVKLSALFIPYFLKSERETAIMNISSGLGFVPMSIMPLYCASKAAIHSYTLSLRHQLKGTNVKVFEVIPPTVDTELDRGAREKRSQAFRGVSPKEVAAEVIKGMENDELEMAIGQSKNFQKAWHDVFDQAFSNMNH